ncbi:hypothetical protein HS125_17000 [bacterium]|nr:hypothetical protein [bacterium]
MQKHELEPPKSLAGAAADVLYSNGVLDLEALSDWLEAREAEFGAQSARLEELEREAEASAPLVEQARAQMSRRRGEVQRGWRYWRRRRRPAELARLRRELLRAESAEQLEALADRVERLIEDALPTRPTAEAVESAGRDVSRQLAAFRMAGGT